VDSFIDTVADTYVYTSDGRKFTFGDLAAICREMASTNLLRTQFRSKLADIDTAALGLHVAADAFESMSKKGRE
jgi:hypothetical protein